MHINTNDIAVVFGNYINAYTLISTLQEIEWDGKIVIFKNKADKYCLAEILNKDIDVEVADIMLPEILPEYIEKKYYTADNIFIFFTDERYHQYFELWRQNNNTSRLKYYLGSVGKCNIIMDRYDFCEYIKKNKLASVPITITGNDDPFKYFGHTFIVRPRFSWFNTMQRERVSVIKKGKNFKEVINSYFSRGLTYNDLCYQEMLSIRNQDNVSVCGWYGSNERYVYYSRKVLQYPPSTGGGDVVELVDPCQEVKKYAHNILNAFSYEGPFELEFVYDNNKKEYKVIELNPRFWLQHGLIEKVSGNALVSSYLGRKPSKTIANDRVFRYWVNPLYTGFRAIKGDLRSLLYYISPHSWSPFSFMDTTLYVYNLIRHKMHNK